MSTSEMAKAAIVHHIRRLSSSSSSSSSSSPPASPSENDWFPFQNAAEFNLNIAVALIFLVCFVIGALALNAILRCLNSEYPNRASSSSATSSSSSSNKLTQMSMGPTLVFSTGIKLAGADHAECAICLSEFVEGEGVRVLPRCKHGFHVKCIESWLSSKTSCPTCRTSCLKVTPEEKNPIPVEQQNGVDVDVEAGGNTELPISSPLQQQQPQQQQS